MIINILKMLQELKDFSLNRKKGSGCEQQTGTVCLRVLVKNPSNGRSQLPQRVDFQISSTCVYGAEGPWELNPCQVCESSRSPPSGPREGVLLSVPRNK